MELPGYMGDPSPSLDAVFAALSDPTRRAILSRLVQGEASVGELAAPFSISQPAVSKHLKALERAGLVERSVDGSRRPARLCPEPLAAANTWLEEYRALWEHPKWPAQRARRMTMADEENEFVLERVFKAPVQMVWRTWTEPELFARWYKPDPNCKTAVLEHDLRAGGVMRYEMRFGEMPPHCERWEFSVVDAPKRLQWIQQLTDPDGNIVGNPRMPDWPRAMHTTIELEEHADGTLQRLTWKPHEATEAEIECFRNASAHLDKGWAGGFDNLGTLLEELVAG